jgi:ADP-ribose pyrophosphatase YjhB (NUDIX family)
MVRNRQGTESWWCLPSGRWESSETPAEGTLREVEEECRVRGRVIERLINVVCGNGEETISFRAEIGDQEPKLGNNLSYPGKVGSGESS